MKIHIPPLKIQGIKSKLVEWIAQYIPTYDTWIEPFIGSGVVGFNLASENAIFADLNPYIIQFYNDVKYRNITSYIVKDFLEEQGGKLEIGGKDYYYEVRERFNTTHNSLDFLFLNRTGFNGMMRFNKDGAFNVPFNHKPQRFAKAYITKIVHQMEYIQEKIWNNNWTFQSTSFFRIINNANKADFIYCDPPYIGRHVDFFDSWSETDEYMLHDCLMQSHCKFMLSTWQGNEFRKNHYLDTLWTGLNIETTKHFYFVGPKETNRHPVVEAILKNY